MYSLQSPFKGDGRAVSQGDAPTDLAPLGHLPGCAGEEGKECAFGAHNFDEPTSKQPDHSEQWARLTAAKHRLQTEGTGPVSPGALASFGQ